MFKHLYDIEKFKKDSPLFYAHFSFQTVKAYEAANLPWIKRAAANCDYVAAIIVAYYDPQALRYDYISKKMGEAVELSKTKEGDNKKYIDYLRKFCKALQNKYPFPGREEKTPSPHLLTQSLIYTYIEIMQILKEIGVDCTRRETIKLFNRNSAFWDSVKEIKLRAEVKYAKAGWNQKGNDEELISSVERTVIKEICEKDPFVVAKFILADDFSVDERTIRKKLVRDIKPDIEAFLRKNSLSKLKESAERIVKERIRKNLNKRKANKSKY